MKTEKDLSMRIEEINKLELTGSIQTKKGRYYVVISYTDENGKSEPITEKVIMPVIEGAIITAEGAGNANVKSSIVSAVEAVTGLAVHKIQVFEMRFKIVGGEKIENEKRFCCNLCFSIDACNCWVLGIYI